ncbi:ras GTPase-activating-like protein IQGAP1 isoform X3 [Anneissia japonica]|uniref:ras GTPase-activating-like protein IQGAP1 isoform X3 n=1 Tax=Anneissia japonica TaxID=1529436 RepID=UPI001425AE77|nr:ras GTPase-activating-like protein IQGAP1 isoform X3 [Anneissia japonica]
MATTNGEADVADGHNPERNGAMYDPTDDPFVPERQSADDMDEQRNKNIAYQYLCHLEEAKKWIEACIDEEMPPTTELEEGLRNGVYLAKLGHYYAPNKVPLKRIYDKEQNKYTSKGLHFRHTDNINYWLRSMEDIGLPQIFYPETTDVYDRKNMPRVVYCVHALSLYLFKLGKAPQIQNLYGKVDFTEEEISIMQMELEKYGIQMPSFGKIGGILAENMSVDEAALHAAVIAINEAVEHENAEETLAALQNPNALLLNVDPKDKQEYQNELFIAKEEKKENALNKGSKPKAQDQSIREGEVMESDVYDTLLTQAEIQGNINKVNITLEVACLNNALNSGNPDEVLRALSSDILKFNNIDPDNIKWYIQELQAAKEAKGQNLDKDDIQASINAANKKSKDHKNFVKAIADINLAIGGQDSAETLKALKRPEAKLPKVYDSGEKLYQSELKEIRDTNEGDLTHGQLTVAVQVLSAVALINDALNTGSSEETVNALLNPDAALDEVEADLTYAERYHTTMTNVKHTKAEDGIDFLTQEEVQQCIEIVNQTVHEEQERILAITAINEAIDEGDAEMTLGALQMPYAKLNDVQPHEAVLYQKQLQAEKEKKSWNSDDESDPMLWLDEIQNAIDGANKTAADMNKLASGVAAINAVLSSEAASEDDLMKAIGNPGVGFHSITPECAGEYLKELVAAKKAKELEGEGDANGDWVCLKTKDGLDYYYNINTNESNWELPEGAVLNSHQLSKEEIQGVLSKVTSNYDRQLLFKSNEDKIITLQAHTRGMIARKSFHDRMDFIRRQLPAIIRIQSWLKGITQKKIYRDRLEYLNSQEDATVKLQSYARMLAAKNKYRKRKQYFKDHVKEVVQIQAFYRANQARNDYHILISSENPPLKVVRKYVHLLDRNEMDLSEELELQDLKAKVVKQIRSNVQLENDLGAMDIKIGLLVKNRITLQDVVTHSKKLKGAADMGRPASGIKSLSKEKRHMLESYQHLFYQLQTNPNYLAKLIFAMPQVKTTKFLESVILSLYNYAANQREEYLLLKLFKTALEEEINHLLIGAEKGSKVDKMMEIITGNPMVIKMVVTFNRGAKGQSSLRSILQPLVKEVMDDKNININTNPVEVYKAWINQKETETGEATNLPYDVSSTVAMEHNEVANRVQESITKLSLVSDKFLSSIISAIDDIPNGMRYIAKTLRNSLTEKFPDAAEDDILKIVGNLIYYRFMNPAIVAPDAFDIVDVGAQKGMTTEQRRNLGSIAKVLQSVASGKTFGGDNDHLSGLNKFVVAAHERFKAFCIKVCDVPELDDRFNINEYSDFVNPTKPVVYMSVQEILDTHALLMEHEEIVAPDRTDPLHELLSDLGEPPSIQDLIGHAPVDTNEQQAEALLTNLAKSEISLTLTNKFEISSEDDTDMVQLFIRTKRLLVDVIRVQPAETVPQVLRTPATDEQEDEHQALVSKRLKQDEKATREDDKLQRTMSVLQDSKLPLGSIKTKIEKNLATLEGTKHVSSEDHYQAMVTAIAHDIRNQRRYRNRRKQELLKLRATMNGLESKSGFYQEQIDFYNRYIETCMLNLQTKTRKSKESKKKKETIKYTGARLHEKGIILEIEGLSEAQFKNVMFEITPVQTAGTFEVTAHFLGVKMDTVQIVFSDLLQLQYDGVAVMKMFSRAKVNVNLLIFLLNKKFYGN